VADKFISIEGITKRFPAPGGGSTTVFEGLWLSMARGEFSCIIGHSGCGKTTVLNILAGLDEPSSGAVIVDNEAIEGPSLDRAVIFQSHALLPWLTVMGNVVYAVASKWRFMSKENLQAHAQKFIDLVGLTGAEHKRPAELSGRHEAARRHHAALDQAEIMLMDEPFSALDALPARCKTVRPLRGGRPCSRSPTTSTRQSTSRRVLLMTNGPDAVLADRENTAQGSRAPGAPPSPTTACAITSSISWSAGQELRRRHEGEQLRPPPRADRAAERHAGWVCNLRHSI
jgi:nitrate/nitrite transport system ATP-binding protein